jgi:hypothetical protein
MQGEEWRDLDERTSAHARTRVDQAPAQAQARIEAEQIDERTLLSIAAWLRRIGAMYPPRRAARLEAVAAFVEAHNKRVSDRAHNRRGAT